MAMHERFASLLADAGGNRGVSLYDDGSGAALVSAGGAEAAQRAAMELLQQMLEASQAEPWGDSELSTENRLF